MTSNPKPNLEMSKISETLLQNWWLFCMGVLIQNNEGPD